VSGSGWQHCCGGVRGVRGEGSGPERAKWADSGDGQPNRPEGERIKELIEERGCELLYLPPYSPDFNPIEEAFFEIKGVLRKAEARSRGALVEVLGAAISAITARDVYGFFEHCGYYSTPVQSL
jgi:DDE superfamily endonuclease